MRPQSIRVFDMLFLGGIALAVLAVALTMAGYGHVPASPAIGPANSTSALLGAAGFGAVIALTLWYLVSRLRFAFLRWVLLALVAYGLVNLPAMLGEGVNASTVLGVVASAMELIAIAFLFRPDARRWLATPEG